MALTIRQYAEQQGIQAKSLQKRIQRQTGQKLSLDSLLPDDAKTKAIAVSDNHHVNNDIATGDYVPIAKPKKAAGYSTHLPVASLVICGLVSSYGCFKFLTFFSPVPVCFIGAFAMVSVYVSLCTMKATSDKAENISKTMSVAAMAVSLMFNVSSIAMFAPEAMSEMSWPLFGFLCILRGAPFPILAYYLSLVIFKLK